MKLLDTNLLSETPDGWVLMAHKCSDCGKLAFPRKDVCPACFGENLIDQPLSKSGTLHTFSCSEIGAPHLEVPYVIGFIDTPEKIKVLSLIIDCDPWQQTLTVGMPMEMVIDKLMTDENGEDIYIYKYRPVQQEQE